MKNVTRQYKNSMKQALRERSHCVVTFGATDQTAITDGAWFGDSASVSSFSYIDYEHTFGNAISTFELNQWTLDGRCSVTRENDGYIASQYMSYVSGQGGTSYPQSIIKRFENTHSINGITLTFDTRRNEWPFKVSVTYYNGVYETELETDTVEPIVDENGVELIALVSSGGSGMIATTTVYPTSSVCEINLNGENVDLVEIKFYSTIPYSRPRLEHITWGVASVFGDGQLISVDQSHDVDPLSRRLPTERFAFTISDYQHVYDPDNPQGAYRYINKGTPISVSFGYEVDGVTEWIKSDKYSLEDAPTFKDSQVTFNGVGLIGTLSNIYYKDTFNANGKTLYSLAENVLQAAGLTPTAGGQNPWEIDTTLQSMYTTAVLPIDTCANLLQLIAHAARCRFFTDDDNIIHIKPFGVTPIGIFDGTYADSGHILLSEWDSVNTGSTNVEDMACFELNRWALDGLSVVELGDGGYIGEPISGADGSNDAYWTKTFNVTHDIPLITFTFDLVHNSYPFKLSVVYYDEEGLITTETVYPTSPTATVQAENVNDCTYIKVTAHSNLPYARPRVTKVAFRETDFTLGLDSIKENSLSTNLIEKLRNVKVTEYKYTKGDSTTLYEEDTTATTLHVEYGAAADITVTVTGGTVTSQNVYAQATDLVLSSGTKHVLITGKPIENSEKIYTRAVNTTGEDDTIQNMLITNSTMSSALAEHIADYLSLRNTYDAAYRGNPELEVGDIIELQTMYSSVVYGIVLTDAISYNGALSGKVKVKGLC